MHQQPLMVSGTRQITKYYEIGCLINAFYVAAHAQSREVRKKHFNLENGLAIQGHDPGAYFTQNKAVKRQAVNTFATKNTPI